MLTGADFGPSNLRVEASGEENSLAAQPATFKLALLAGSRRHNSSRLL